MSKKKAFSGNTMTLKDFHGGSIPSDLPLPSAPGVIVRPTDRPGYDRQTSWGNSMGRSDHRLRPSSSGSGRNLDDKSPFLTNSAHIGRNFDEDERKPLDGPSAPRRTVIDESIRAPSMRLEARGDVGSFVRQPGLGQVVPQNVGAISGSSYSAGVIDGGHSGVCAQPNAWGVRKEAVGVPGTVSSAWSGQSTVSKFAQASALDQISSGRWQTKPTHHQPDIEVIRQSDSPKSLYARQNDSYGGGVNYVSDREYEETTLLKHVERGLVIEEGTRGDVKEMSGSESRHSFILSDERERSSVLYTNDGQPAYPDGKYGGSDSLLPPEVSERPKLKLLPRTKPLDVPQASDIDYKQGIQQPIDSGHSETSGNIHESAILLKPRPSSSEAGNRQAERPKLNLKPRSQPLDHSEGSIERERTSLFGGARPREMVLKERGADNVVNSHNEAQGPSRMKNDIPRTEVAPARANVLRHGDRVDTFSSEHRTGRGQEKGDQRADVQKADMQRKNWRNESWRNGRDAEKHHQQDRPPSPDTWRKPIEQPKASDTDNSGLRYGKAVSAVELAQAFSRSVSDPKSVDQFSGQRGLPGRSKMPFSRLTGPTRPQINGY